MLVRITKDKTQTCSHCLKNYSNVELALREGTLEGFRTSDNYVETTGTFSNCEIIDSDLGRKVEHEDEASDDDNEPIVCYCSCLSGYT